jgi:hypothetical protein
MDKLVVPVSKLVEKYFVRKELNSERVRHFADAYQECPSDVPPIEVTPKLVLLRGRHRRAGAVMAGYTDVPVVVVSNLKTPEEEFNYALQADLVSALPQSRADMAMVIKAMLASGASDDAIKKAVKSFPGARGILHQVKQNAVNMRIAAAKRYRDEQDCSYQTAAEKFGVAVDALKALYSSKVKPYYKLSRELDKLNKRYGRAHAALLRKAREQYELGSLTEAQTFEFLRKTGSYSKQIQANTDDAINRFSALVATENSLVSAG